MEWFPKSTDAANGIELNFVGFGDLVLSDSEALGLDTE